MITDSESVTTIIPLYNHENLVAKSISSVLCQTYDNIQLIVIDDGSTDSSYIVAKKIIDDYVGNKNVELLRQENSGICATLNLGLRKATGNFFQILASDDYYHPAKTAVLVDKLQQLGGKTGAVYSDGYIVDMDGEILTEYSRVYPFPIRYFTYENLIVGNWVPIMGCLFRTSALVDVGGFDANLRIEDYDLLLRLSRSYDIGREKGKFFYYRTHPQSFTSNTERMQSEMRLIQNKHSDLRKWCDTKEALKNFDIHIFLKNVDLKVLIVWLIRKLLVFISKK